MCANRVRSKTENEWHDLGPISDSGFASDPVFDSTMLKYLAVKRLMWKEYEKSCSKGRFRLVYSDKQLPEIRGRRIETDKRCIPIDLSHPYGCGN